MILDHLDQAHLYFGLSPDIRQGLRFLREQNPGSLPLGKREIDGKRIFAIIQEYQTKPVDRGFWESHRQYTDIQYVVSGCERIGYAHAMGMTPGSYDADKDLLVHQGHGEWARVPAGFFMILMPHDVHMPQIMVSEPQPVRKIVIKVAVA